MKAIIIEIPEGKPLLIIMDVYLPIEEIKDFEFVSGIQAMFSKN